MSRKFEVAKGFENEGINLPARQTEHAAGYDFEASEDVVVYPMVWEWLKSLVLKPNVTSYEFGEQEEGSVVINSLNSIETLPLEDESVIEEAEKQSGAKPWRKALKPTLVPTGVKADMNDDEALFLYNRSSNPLKKFLVLANGVGVIDADFYENPDNDGHIMFQFVNFGLFPVTIKKGDRIGQGVFQPFLKTDDDVAGGKRTGGHGSTGENK